MPRKKRHEEHENHERWLVSYADFITLLFAFFTSMYAMSSVNEGKYRILSESLAVAFSPSMYTSARLQEGPRFVHEYRPSIADEFRSAFSSKFRKVEKALRNLEEQHKLRLLVDKDKITIRIDSGVIFKPSSDEILDEGAGVLKEVAAAVRDMSNPVTIEGHTDNIPISTERFPSNWDLSSARAITILKLFINEHSVDPKRLSAVGYGEYRPVETNDTPSGRKSNRRVDILVSLSSEVPEGP